MYFKSILIADIQQKTAHFHEFAEGLNIITSHDNHVGKSSLLKSLYYAMGAEVGFDDVWDKNSKLCIVKFLVNDKEYSIVRLQKSFAVFLADELILTTRSVSRDLAKEFEEIFSFSVYLANKSTSKIELAPPVFTFMPYYIDQDTGWSGLYGSFSNIDQYKKPDRIKSLYYHLGIFTRSTVEKMAEKDLLKSKIEVLKKEEENLRITLDSIYNETQNLIPAETVEELEKNLEIPKAHIASLVKQIGDVRNKIQSLETTLYQHQHQLEVIKEYKSLNGGSSITAKEDLTSVNQCPNCGYSFDEEIYNIVRTNYNLRNEDYMHKQVEQIIDSIISELDPYKARYVELMEELNQQEKAFDETQDSYEIYLRQRGLQDSLKHFNQKLEKRVYEQSVCLDKIKKIDKDLRKLPNKKKIEEKYIENVRLNIIKLDAWNIAYDGNIKLLKPIKAQGTLENKIILSQIVGLFQTMNYFKRDTILLPFVVDSPRGNEASNTSSKDILKMILEIEELPQIILATIDYNEFDINLQRRANISVLQEKRKLLDANTYTKNKEMIEDLTELLSRV